MRPFSWAARWSPPVGRLPTYSGRTPIPKARISTAIASLGALLLGAPIVVRALKKTLVGRPGGDLLVALAIVVSFASSDYRSAGLVAFLLLLANLIEMRTALGARASIEGLMRLSPKKALRLLADGRAVEVDSQSLESDHVVRVLPGENIPVDGVIVRGRSAINQASITGESLPVDRREGDEVFGGPLTYRGLLTCESRVLAKTPRWARSRT